MSHFRDCKNFKVCFEICCGKFCYQFKVPFFKTTNIITSTLKSTKSTKNTEMHIKEHEHVVLKFYSCMIAARNLNLGPIFFVSFFLWQSN